MGRTLIQKILYKRRKFITKKRLKSVVEIIASLLPAVIPLKPELAPLSGILDELLHKTDNDTAVQSGDVNSKYLRQRIKELKTKLNTTQDTAEVVKLRRQLDEVYALLFNDDNPEGVHE